MSSSFNDPLRFLCDSPHSQNFYAEFQRFPQRILSPVTVIMLLCICKGIRCVQNLSKSCSALLGAGREGGTFHFYRCAAFGFPVRHHIPCFSEKAVCRPCDTFAEGKTQCTEGLFYDPHCFRGRFCIPGGRKRVIGCTLIPQRFGRDEKLVLCHFDQHAARACRNNFPAPANLLTSVNSLNKKIIKNLLPGAVEHPATLISRQHSLSAENHRNGSSETINRHQEMAGNAEIQ